jgi:hypothetical protein
MAVMMDLVLEADADRHMDDLEPELACVLEEFKVPRVYRATIGRGGFETVAKFRHLATGLDDLRNFLRDTYGLDAGTSLKARSAASSILAAWENSKGRMKR